MKSFTYCIYTPHLTFISLYRHVFSSMNCFVHVFPFFRRLSSVLRFTDDVPATRPAVQCWHLLRWAIVYDNIYFLHSLCCKNRHIIHRDEMSHLLAFEFAVLAGDRERCWVNVCSASPPSVLSTLRSLLTPYCMHGCLRYRFIQCLYVWI